MTKVLAASWTFMCALGCTVTPAKTYEPLVPGPEYPVPTARDVQEEPAAYLPQGCPGTSAPVDSWAAFDPASLSREQRLVLRDSRCSWFVVLDGATGSVVTGRRAPVSEFGLNLPLRLRHPSRVVRRPGGYLVGVNRGEWGGSLNWYTPQGTPGGVLLVDNIVDIIPGPPSTVVLTGLAHLGGDRGYLVEVDEGDGAFRIGRRFSLGSAPHAAMREASGSILVATHDGLLRIAPSHAIEELARYADGGLYATSIAIDAHGVIYVGLRGAVARFTPSDQAYREQWLLAVALPL